MLMRLRKNIMLWNLKFFDFPLIILIIISFYEDSQSIQACEKLFPMNDLC